MKRTDALLRRCLPALQGVFHLDGFRPGQAEAVDALLHDRDLLCVMPTGSGKSLCYQLPTLLRGGMTLVVSPLIALIRDQTAHLDALGIAVCFLDSLQNDEEKRQAYAAIRGNDACLVYVSPERLGMAGFRQLCIEHPPGLVVVDEAHCIVRWGQDFRPAYRKIADFLSVLPHRPVVCAMTATADTALRRDISRELRLHHPKTVVLPMTRANLHYRVKPTIDRDGVMLAFILARQDRGIVFCMTRLRCEQVAALLRRAGIAATHYHAGMTREERNEVQQGFAQGAYRVIAATSAFGMGVDLPDIRFVIHDALPENLLDYAQQAGRGGRDEQDADCLLLLDPADICRSRHRFARRRREACHPKDYAALWRDWQDYRKLLDWCLCGRCLSDGLSRAFGQHSGNCGTCSACRRAEKHHGYRPLTTTPSLLMMSDIDVRCWALRWMRDGLARENKLRPSRVLGNAALQRAARVGQLDPDAVCSPGVYTRLSAVLHHLYHA